MIRGTTPTLTFNLPCAVSLIQSLYITFEDKSGETVLEKTLADCDTADNSVSVTLTQEETLLFKERTEIRLQVRALTTEGDAVASRIYTMPVKEILKEGVI